MSRKRKSPKTTSKDDLDELESFLTKGTRAQQAVNAALDRAIAAEQRTDSRTLLPIVTLQFGKDHPINRRETD